MTKRTGGQLVVECLKNFGATKAFGVPGESYLPILDALYDTKGELDFITCRQEGGAAFMAAAWGKLTGDPGIAMVTRGPGATNASIGVHAAKQDSVPMLLLVGQVSTEHLGREAFQEVDYKFMFADLAKGVVQIDKADRIPELMSRAWKIAINGRPGPVVVVLPEDVLFGESRAECSSYVPYLGFGDISFQDLANINEILEDAERPLILLNGTYLKNQKALQGYAESLGLPVICTSRTHDGYDNTSLTYIGEAGVAMPAHVEDALRNSDCILALGPRFGEMATQGWRLFNVPLASQKIIHIHPSEEEIGKIYQPTYAVVSDLADFADILNTSMKPKRTWFEWCAVGRKAHLDFLKRIKTTAPVNMAEVTAHLQNTLPADAILTNGAGNFTFWPNKVFQYGPDQRLLAPISGAMGYGVPAAIAAKVHDPLKTVVCFAGDGDFQMTCQELATARQYAACPIILLINNGRYGTIRMH